MMRSFFTPKSVAIVGASVDPGKAGHQILLNLKRLGFTGEIYPINPKETQILDLKCYPNLLDIPEEVELMIVVIPAPLVPSVFEQARKRGDVRASIVVSAGFSETGDPDRIELENRIKWISDEAGIRILGPNCVGIMNTGMNLDTSFAPGVKQTPGGMSIMTQSGSLGASILMFDGDQPVPLGFSKFAHVGNMCDVDMLEILKYYRTDSSTKVIGVYMEGFANAREFMETAKTIAEDKPVVVLKVGKTNLGASAAFSHTGSLAGSDDVYDGAFEQSGIVRVDTIEELLDTARALGMQSLPKGNRICILTEAGGMGITAMDALLEMNECELSDLSLGTVKRLKEILPPMATINQPKGYIDMTAAGDEEQHGLALETVLMDPNVDGVVLLSVPPTFLSPVKLAQEIHKAASGINKPVLSCIMAGDWVKEARRFLEARNYPTFDMPDRASRAMSNMVKRFRLLKSLGDDSQKRLARTVDSDTVSDILRRAVKRGATEVTARQLLGFYRLDVGPYALVQTLDEAKEAARNLGYPLVAKIVSPQIVHKTDVGGVVLNIADDFELAQAINKIRKSVNQKAPEATIDGYLLAPHAKSGPEVIVGAVKDVQMGPMVMFGMGGVFVEVFSDMVFKMAPISKETAINMIKSIKASKIFQGYRGSEPLDIDALAECIVKMSEIIALNPEVTDIELNPVRVYPTGIGVLDARLKVSDTN